MDRRIFLTGAAVVAAGGLGWRLWPAPVLQFDHTGVPEGFRRLVRQGGSGGITGVLTGVSLAPLRAPLGGASLCRATFEGARLQTGKVAIASFSDYFCPYCRVLDETLRDVFGKDDRVRFIWHQVPLLGRASDMAARGILAARVQGVEDALHQRLIRTTFVPNPAYLRDFARTSQIDPERFMADLRSDRTEAQLARSAAAFRAFGFVGTPGIVVGRTIVSGAISKAELRALVAEEIAAPMPAICA